MSRFQRAPTTQEYTVLGEGWKWCLTVDVRIKNPSEDYQLMENLLTFYRSCVADVTVRLSDLQKQGKYVPREVR